MKLEQMKSAWLALEQQLARQNALQSMQMRDAKMRKTRNSFWPLIIGQSMQLIAGLALIALSASFWAQHLGTPHLMVYGISIHLYGILIAAFSGQQLYFIHHIDYSANVADIQKRIAEIQRWHARSGWLWAMSGCVIWVPMLLIAFYWLGADLWVHKPRVVYGFVASSIVCLAVTGFLYWLARHPARSKFGAWLYANSMPNSLRKAEQALSEIEQFEKI
jgi:hypothetical protein